MSDYKLDNSCLYSSNGRRLGKLEGTRFYDDSGRTIGQIDGNSIRDESRLQNRDIRRYYNKRW